MRQDYEEVLGMCRDNDLSTAWKRLLRLLEGELFAAGPNFRYQPMMRDLQRNTLLLAVDLSRRLQDEGLFDLLLETIDWFPEEAFFWLQLAEAAPRDYRGAIIKQLALERASQLLPLDRDIRRRMGELRAALGRPDKHGELVVCNKRPYEASEVLAVEPVRVEVHATDPLNQLVERICEVAEDLLETAGSAQRRRNVGNSSEFDGIKLTYPIEIAVNFEDRTSEETAERVEVGSQPEDHSVLQLSQAGSQKNLGDFSQTRRRRLRQREATDSAPKEARMNVQEYAKKLGDALDDLDVDLSTESAVDLAFEIKELMHCSTQVAFRKIEADGGKGMGVGNALLGCSNLQLPLIQALVRCVSWLDDAGHLVNPRPLYANCARRLVAALLSPQSDVDYVITQLSGSQLIWLAECSRLLANITNGTLDYLLPRIWLKIDPIREPLLVVRYLWLLYHSRKNPRELSQAETILRSQSNTIIPLCGTFDGRQMMVVSAESLRLERSHAEMRVLLDQALRTAGDLGGLLGDDQGIMNPINLFRERPMPLEHASEWCLLLLEKTKMEVPVEICILTLGLSMAVEKRLELAGKFISHPQFPSILGPLSRKHRSFFGSLINEVGATREFVLGMVKALGSGGEDSLTNHAEFIILTLRDVLDRETLGQSRSLFDEIAQRLVPTTTGSRILLHCALSLLLDAPWLDLVDEWGLCKHLTGVALKETLPIAELALQHLASITELTSVASTLISSPEEPNSEEYPSAGEIKRMPLKSDPLRTVSFCDHLLSLLFSIFAKSSQYKYCLATLEGALTKSINIARLLPPPFILASHPEANGTISALFALKQRAIEGISASTAFIKRRKSVDGVRESIEETHHMLLLCQERDTNKVSELLEYLGDLYDAELRLLLVNDADKIFAQSPRIKGLILGVHNVHRLTNNTILATSLPFYQSTRRGILSLFLSAAERAHMGAFLWERVLTAEDDWLSLILQALAIRLMGRRTRDPYLALRIHTAGLLSLATEHGNGVPSTLHAASTLYGIALDVLWMLVDLYKGGTCSSLAETLLDRLNLALLPVNDDPGKGKDGMTDKGGVQQVIEEQVGEENIIKSKISPNDAKAPVGSKENDSSSPQSEPASSQASSHSFLDRLTSLLHRLASHLDRKGMQHRHLALLARINQCGGRERLPTLLTVRTTWSKLIPSVLKPKSTLVLAVWQNEQDYPGDYHWYGECYIRQAALDIANGSSGLGEEKAKLLNLLIGKVISAPALFIRRRLLVKDLLQLFHKWLMGGPDPPIDQANSLDAFMHNRGEDIRELYESTVQLAETCGVHLPDPSSRGAEESVKDD